MELRQQLALLRSRLWLILVCGVLAAVAAYAVSGALPKVYEGNATLIVGQSLSSSNPDYNAILASQRLSQTYADLATTTPILQKVIAKNGLSVSPTDFRRQVSAQAPLDSTLVHITVQDPSPQRAADLANSVAAEMIAASSSITGRDSQIQQFIDQDLAATASQIRDTESQIQDLASLPSRTTAQSQQLDALQGRLVSLRQTYATMLGYSSSGGANLLTVVDPASPPTEPSSPRVLLNTLIAALIGLLLAIGLVFLFDYLDDTIKTAEDIEALVGLPTLGWITRIRGGKASERSLAALLDGHSAAAEAYRSLRTNVEFATVDEGVQTLLVTSAAPSEGKTTTAANLAVVFAQAGRRTILLDADFRRPGIHEMFGLPNVRGLSYLLLREGMSISSVVQPTPEQNLVVISTGPPPPNPAELLASQRMKTTLARLADFCDLVIVDSPPLLAVTDAAILASVTSGTLLIVDVGRTRRGAIRSARETLALSDARVLGVALNRMPEQSGARYYDYYGSYAEGESPGGAQVQARSAQGSGEGR